MAGQFASNELSARGRQVAVTSFYWKAKSIKGEVVPFRATKAYGGS